MNFFKGLLLSCVLLSPAYADEWNVLHLDSDTEQHQASKLKSFNKCQLNVDETISALKNNGYQLLIKFWDQGKPYISRHIEYNTDHNDIAIVSFVYDKDKFKEKDVDTSKPVKICTEFTGGNVEANGEGFRRFFINQIIQGRQKEHDDYLEEKQKELKKKDEPYQGDLWQALKKKDEPYQGNPWQRFKD